MRRPIVWFVLFLLLLVPSVQVEAGGWAAVHLDQPPGDLEVESPWRFGFMVLQHDITPTSDVEPVVSAQNIETGEVVTIPAVQEGRVGHFVAELTLPSAGEWKWSIAPEPFAATTFEPLFVGIAGRGRVPRVADLREGSCGTSVKDASAPTAETLVTWNVPAIENRNISLSVTTAEVALRELLEGDFALSVGEESKGAMMLACGEIAGSIEDLIVIGLRPIDASTTAGIALLRSEGDRTAIALYLLDLQQALPAEELVATAKVEIVGDESNGAWFSPVSLTVRPGTRVTWENSATTAHMVSGEDLVFEDSGWLEPGASFSQVFDEPGRFHYRCGPHPWMEGTVVVV